MMSDVTCQMFQRWNLNRKIFMLSVAGEETGYTRFQQELHQQHNSPLPHGFPDYWSVYHYFRIWRDIQEGTNESILDTILKNW